MSEKLCFNKKFYLYAEFQYVDKIACDFTHAKVFDMEGALSYLEAEIDGAKMNGFSEVNRIYMFPFDEENYEDVFVEISNKAVEITIAGAGRIECNKGEFIIYPKGVGED